MNHFIIVTYLFCSETAIASKRWREMADLLCAHGRVTAICADGSSVPNPAVRVIHVPDRHNTMPVRNGFAGRADNRWLVRGVRHLAQSFLFWPDRQKWWARRAVEHVGSVCRDNSYPIVITSGPRFSVHTEMRRWLNRGKKGLCWVMDLRDPWTNDPAPAMRRRTPSFLTRVEARMEKACHHRADVITTVSDVMTEMMEKDFGSRPITIYNGYPDGRVNEETAKAVDKRGRPAHICYLGSIIHGLRSPALLFEAAQRLNISEERIQFDFWCNDPQLIAREAAAFGVEHLIICHSAVSLEESNFIQCGADANLVLNGTDDTANHMITGKAFELIAVRRPAIAVTGPRSELRGILEQCGCNGLVWDKPTAALALENLLKGELRPLSDESQQFSRRAAVEKFVHALATLRTNRCKSEK